MYGILIPVGGGDPIPLRKNEVVIGRRGSCDIVLEFANISGKHCQLVLSNGYWYVQDLKSKNGVKINGKQVTDQRVDPGATLAIAKHLFTIQYDPVQNGATGPPPAQLLNEDDILSRSLMEKAGIQRPTFKQSEEPGSTGSTVTDVPIVVVPKPAANTQGENGKKDFFSHLIFD